MTPWSACHLRCYASPKWLYRFNPKYPVVGHLCCMVLRQDDPRMVRRRIVNILAVGSQAPRSILEEIAGAGAGTNLGPSTNHLLDEVRPEPHKGSAACLRTYRCP